MTVNEFCGVTDRIRRNCVLTFDKRFTRGLVGNHRAEAEFVEHGIEERKLFVEVKTQRKPYRRFRILDRIYDAVKQSLILIRKQIGQNFAVLFALTAFATVA